MPNRNGKGPAGGGPGTGRGLGGCKPKKPEDKGKDLGKGRRPRLGRGGGRRRRRGGGGNR